MNDSEEKKESPKEEEKTSGETTALVLSKKKDKRLRGPDGKFLGKKPTYDEALETLYQLQKKRLLKVNPVTKLTTYAEMYEALIKIALTPAGVDIESGLPDAKWAEVQRKCFAEVMDRLEGKAAPSKKVLDKLSLGNVKMVFIDQSIVNKPPEEEKKYTTPKEPAFIDGEVVEDKEKKKIG